MSMSVQTTFSQRVEGLIRDNEMRQKGAIDFQRERELDRKGGGRVRQNERIEVKLRTMN